MTDSNKLADVVQLQEKAVPCLNAGGSLESFLEQKQSVSPDLISRYDAFLRARRGLLPGWSSVRAGSGAQGLCANTLRPVGKGANSMKSVLKSQLVGSGYQFGIDGASVADQLRQIADEISAGSVIVQKAVIYHSLDVEQFQKA
jgi:hypothetical protein